MNIFHTVFTEWLAGLLSFTGDWFWAITLFTLVLKLVLLPLSIKQRRSILITKSFSEVKGLLVEKLNNQTDKINEALAKVMLNHKVNPLSSMILIVIQAPILISMYFSISHLSTTVGSGVISWVLNVSNPDSLHIAPIIASIFGGLQGVVGEPVGFKLSFMHLVPIIIGLIFLWKAPIGLSVYWFVNSAFGVLEKVLFNIPFIKERFLKIPTSKEMIDGVL